MDTTKRLTADDIQFYLGRGALLLPIVYEHLLVELSEMVQEEKVCLLPTAIFDLYHIRLRRKLTQRIAQYQQRATTRKIA